MTIRIEIPNFLEGMEPNLFMWRDELAPSLSIQIDGYSDGVALASATSDDPLDFYKLGVYVAIHIRATRDLMEREAKKQALEN